MIDSAICPPSNFSAVMIGGIIRKWEQRKTLRTTLAEDVR